MDQDEFWRTDGGKTLAAAQGYLQAASIVRCSEQWLVPPVPLARPTLHLVAHALELFLKYPHLASGVPRKVVTRDYGHDLSKLWADPKAEKVKLACWAAGEASWNQARASGQWPDDDFSDRPRDVLNAAVEKLSLLHGRESHHALRYPALDSEWTPRPMFLIETFSVAVESAIQDPHGFC
ncbi:hypothetical protein [Rhizobium wuzhouense]|uniref:HEPN domain-containing protein n=1 Tax=Rhizobium wuzhouense TaxID=1986026 RepID=A0ABX5NWX6_9HYPH|nr:hypothetical protein [Rhizobium wuzhouense]PYB77677.1 hypothetical protein DMY87_04840 [Rhizobium wuzhouense]